MAKLPVPRQQVLADMQGQADPQVTPQAYPGASEGFVPLNPRQAPQAIAQGHLGLADRKSVV